MQKLSTIFTGNRLYLFLVSLFISTAIFLSYPKILEQLNAWEVLPRVNHPTELFFNDHSSLPTNYRAGENQTVIFSIGNTSTKSTNYTYEVVQSSTNSNDEVILSSGTVKVESRAISNEKVNFSYRDYGEKTKITIRLVNQNQSIHYWVRKA